MCACVGSYVCITTKLYRQFAGYGEWVVIMYSRPVMNKGQLPTNHASHAPQLISRTFNILCMCDWDVFIGSSVFSPEFSQGVVGGCALGGVSNHIKA